jgi:hypothetical protein
MHATCVEGYKEDTRREHFFLRKGLIRPELTQVMMISIKRAGLQLF